MSSETDTITLSNLNMPENTGVNNKKTHKSMSIKIPNLDVNLSSSYSDSATKSPSGSGNISPMIIVSPSYFEDTGGITNYDQMLLRPSSSNTMKQEVLPVSITTNDSDVIYRRESDLSDTTLG